MATQLFNITYMKWYKGSAYSEAAQRPEDEAAIDIEVLLSAKARVLKLSSLLGLFPGLLSLHTGLMLREDGLLNADVFQGALILALAFVSTKYWHDSQHYGTQKGTPIHACDVFLAVCNLVCVVVRLFLVAGALHGLYAVAVLALIVLHFVLAVRHVRRLEHTKDLVHHLLFRFLAIILTVGSLAIFEADAVLHHQKPSTTGGGSSNTGPLFSDFYLSTEPLCVALNVAACLACMVGTLSLFSYCGRPETEEEGDSEESEGFVAALVRHAEEGILGGEAALSEEELICNLRRKLFWRFFRVGAFSLCLVVAGPPAMHFLMT